MFKMKFPRFFYLFLSFTLLIAPLPMVAIAAEVGEKISEMEIDIISQNPDINYIYLGSDESNIANVVSQLCKWDEDLDSPLHKLHNHINEGFSIAEFDSVMEALEYAE